MIVDSALYRRGRRTTLDHASADYQHLREGVVERGDFVWVGLYDPTDAELADVAAAFDLHPLAVEDAANSHQRPKLDHYDDSLFLVLKTLWYVDEDDAVETGEINLFVGRDFVVSVRHGQGSHLQAARSYLESTQSVLEHGPTSAVYAVCDTVVDGYTDVINELQIDVDEIESSVFSTARTNDAERIYTLKREIAEVRRAVLPLQDPMRRASEGSVPGMEPEGAPFFRDVLDHLNRAAEVVHDLDDLLSTAFSAHLARVSVQQNDDMRKISAGIGLVAVPTLIAGVYGMNFRYMPELDWRLGYPLAMVMMVAFSIALLVFFKKSGWL
ncbi:magnesium/cobalt transporter CorA [Nocardioides sp.]|uniref:magnesium/cobalt transporter CorA n=1 Tax=Nocardioides sp. TaxID=35761 RepID=UPI00356624A7